MRGIATTCAERLQIVRLGSLELTLARMEFAQTAGQHGEQHLIAYVPREPKTFEEVLVRLGAPVEVVGHDPQPKERLGQHLRIAAGPGDRNASLRQGISFVETTGQAACLAGDVHRTGARHVLLLRLRMRERLQDHAIPETRLGPPEPLLEPVDHCQARRAASRRGPCVLEREEDVLALGVEADGPGHLPRPFQFALRAFRKRDVVAQVAVADRGFLARLREALPCVLPHRLEQPVASRLCVERDQRLFD